MSFLYLEDYLEMIEGIPPDVTDKLRTIKELDSKVNNCLEILESKVDCFFGNIENLTAEKVEEENQFILSEYDKAINDSDEKLDLTESIADYIAKYVKRLDQDLMKFKLELESDSPGITEIIDKRVEQQLQRRQAISHSQPQILAKRVANRRNPTYELPLFHEQQIADEKEPENHVEIKFPQITLSATTSTSSVVFSMDQMSPGGSAIAAAASQAIVATQQMQQGRRTASLKASFEAINSAGVATSLTKAISSDVGVSKELAGAAQTAVAATQERRKKKRRRRIVMNTFTGSSVDSSAENSPAFSISSQPELMEEDTAEPDPNEPRYCICNEVAFGDMVACDNKSCPYEWYHYPCVGITDPPKGKWFCPQCIATMRKRTYKKHM